MQARPAVRSTVRRLVVLGTAVLLAATAAATIPASPAGAVDVPTGITDLAPVTWVDGSGRQYVAMSAGQAGGLRVARDTAAGQPDATWGTADGTAGLRSLTIEPPAAGTWMNRLLAASSDGTLTTVWESQGCASDAACNRWYVRTDATGEPVGSPTLATGSPPPLRGLTDGSILTGAPGGSVSWRSPTGADRGTLPVATAALRGAGVDGAGRLLVTTTAGSVTRWPAGGPADLALTTSCTASLAIGAGTTDDGFATACGASAPAGVVTTRYESDGSIRWATTGVTVDHGTLDPALVAIDSTDRVWIAGLGSALYGSYAAPITAVASVTQAGPQAPGYQRLRQGISNYDVAPSGVTDLRPVLGGHVAFADRRNCCDHHYLGDLDNDRVLGQVLPKPATPSAPPTCLPRAVTITAATRASATVSFQGCAPSAGGPAPTGYVVETRTASSTAVTTALPASADAPLTATVTTSSPPGMAVYVSAVNADGAGPYGEAAITFLPFRTYDDYIDRQYRDLVGHAPSPAEHDDALQNWVYGHDASGLVGHLADTGRAPKAVEPIARLYRAYFLRDADITGLRYWVRRREAGATLGRVSELFNRSSEFRRRYGDLSNRAFVERIYTDVLGRTGDPTGIDFWTRQLDTGRKNRGAVMVNFSESNEYVTKTASKVQPVAAFFLLLDRLPTAADGTLTADPARAAVAYAIYRTDEYDTRVP